MFINACNQDILSLWRGNVDLQYIINEIATVKYVCSYMTKGEKGMGETLKRVAKECQNDAIQTQMNKIRKEFPWQMSIRSTRISNVSIVNVANEKSRKVVSVSTHSEYCCKNKSCHFGFPKTPCSKNTHISTTSR